MVEYRNILFYVVFPFIGIVNYIELDLEYSSLPCFGDDDIILIFDMQEAEAKRIINLLDKYLERK